MEIKIIWVVASYRNKGIGTLLLKHVEEVAKDKGATISMLDTFDFQAEAFYLKNGYEAIGEIKISHRAIDGYIFLKDLLHNQKIGLQF